MIYISVENESDKELTHVCNLSFRSGSCAYIVLALNFFQNLSSQNLVRVISFHTPYAKILRGGVFYVLRGGADGRSILTSCFTAFTSLFVFLAVVVVVFFSAYFYFTRFMPRKPSGTFFPVNTVLNIAIFIQLFPF